MHEGQSTASRKRERLRYLYRHGGLRGMLFYLCYALANRVTRLRVFRVGLLDATALLDAQLNQLRSFRHGLVSPAELEAYLDDPENDLTRDFLDYAAAQGDSCYATFDGNKLISYCWNSLRPTAVESDLQIECRPGYVYRYKEFTRRSHRGRRLSAFARAESLRRFAAFGFQGFAGYVEADNFVSYRSLQRAGHHFPGFIVVLGRGPEPWIWHSPGARAAGFKVSCTVTSKQPRGAIKSLP